MTQNFGGILTGVVSIGKSGFGWASGKPKYTGRWQN
jgi:hypothetical protein